MKKRENKKTIQINFQKKLKKKQSEYFYLFSIKIEFSVLLHDLNANAYSGLQSLYSIIYSDKKIKIICNILFCILF